MEQSTTQADPLAALGAHLASRRFTIDFTALGLTVTSPTVADYCHPMCASDTITCRPREDDDGRPWFFDGQGRPIAEVGRITDATVAIKGALATRCPACMAINAGAER